MNQIRVVRFLMTTMLLAAPVVHAANVQIGAGPSSGEYTSTIVPAISAALQKIDPSHSAEAVVSAGSQENLSRLIDGELDVALVQMDVLALNPSDDIQLVEMIAPEALLCAAHVDGRVRSYYNLTDERTEQPVVVSVGSEGSGSAATMSYVLALDPDFDIDNIAIINENNTDAELDRLAAGTRDMVCFVMLANPDNPLIAKVHDSDDLQFIDFVSAYALQASVSDFPVYEESVVPVSKGLWGFRAKKVQTLTTWMALVARKDADPAVVAALREAASTPDLLPPTTAAGKAKRLYGDWKDKAKDMSARAKDKAIELKDRAKERTLEMTAKAKEKAGDLTTKAAELSSKAKEKAGELAEKAVEKAGDLKEKAGDLTSKAVEKAGDLKQKAADAVQGSSD